MLYLAVILSDLHYEILSPPRFKIPTTLTAEKVEKIRVLKAEHARAIELYTEWSERILYHNGFLAALEAAAFVDGDRLLPCGQRKELRMIRPLECINDNHPPAADGLLDHISASTVKLYLTCPLKFWFKKALLLPNPVSPELHLGKAMHSALQCLHKARWRGQSHDRETVQRVLARRTTRRKKRRSIRMRKRSWPMPSTGWAAARSPAR